MSQTSQSRASDPARQAIPTSSESPAHNATPANAQDHLAASNSLARYDDDVALWGELREGLHIAGYTFERACSRLRRLIEGERWRLDGRFTDPNQFLDSIRLESLRASAEARKEIARFIKDTVPGASNRRIARTLGVDEGTIRNDIAENSASAHENGSEISSPDQPRAEFSAFSGERAAKLVERRETAGADRLARVAADEQRVLNLRPKPGKYRTLVIDPAWEYDWLSIAGRAKPGYAMQTLDQLRALDLKQWAADDGCHLYCWATNNFLTEAGKLVEHWGFQHRVALVWIKPPPFGLGSYFRNSTEIVLFATLGDTTTRHAAASIPTHFDAPRGEHSEKPERFYEIVRAASYPPYGEAFQRKARPDFVNLYEPVNETPSSQLAAAESQP